METLLDLQPLRPSFVSVTYRGGPSSRQRTTDLVFSMLRLTALNPMAHLTCAGHSRLELADILVGFRKAGVENLMALGGDPPTDASVGRASWPTPSSWWSWPGPSAVFVSASPPTPAGTPSRAAWPATGASWPRSYGLPTSP